MARSLAKMPTQQNRSVAAGMRVTDLLSRLALEEKTTPMMCRGPEKTRRLLRTECNLMQSCL